MNLKTDMDSNLVANEIMHEIIDIDRVEKMMSPQLSSEDLFKIDCGILSSLRATQDFSRDLLNKLEKGSFELFVPRTLDSDIQTIQQQVMADITMPLQKMFDDLMEYV